LLFDVDAPAAGFPQGGSGVGTNSSNARKTNQDKTKILTEQRRAFLEEGALDIDPFLL